MVVLKTGKTDDGVRAARSHTASLAGSYDAFAAVCRAHGVVLVDDPVTMIRVADLLLRYPRLTAMASASCPVPAAAPASWSIALSVPGFAWRVCHRRRVPHWASCCCRRRPTTRSIWAVVCPSQPDDIAVPALRALVADPDVGMLLLYLTTMPFFEARTALWRRARWTAASRWWR